MPSENESQMTPRCKLISFPITKLPILNKVGFLQVLPLESDNFMQRFQLNKH